MRGLSGPPVVTLEEMALVVWRTLADVALEHQVLGRIGGIGREHELAAGEVIDEGMGEHVARRVGQVADRKGAHLRAGVVQEAAPPQVGQPGVRAPRALADGVRRVRMDDLLAGEDVRIGVRSEHPRAILLGRGLQRGQDFGIDLELTELADDLARAVVGLVERDLVVVDRVAQRFLGEVDVRLRLPGVSRRNRGQGRQGGDAAEQGAPHFQTSPSLDGCGPT